MKNILLFSSLILLLSVIDSVAQYHPWVKKTKTSYESYSYGQKVAAVSDGYIYGGYFKGQIQLENDSLTVGGFDFQDTSPYSDALIFKTDFNGNVIWKHQIGGDYYSEVISALATDDQDNIYMAGTLASKDPKLDGNLISGKNNNYLMKLNSKGDTLWMKYSGARINNITVDKKNNVYLIGDYTADTDLFGLYLKLVGGRTMMVAKINQNGKILKMAKGTPGGNYVSNVNVYGYDVAVDDYENVYVVGEASNAPLKSSTIAFGNLSFTTNKSVNYVAKLDSSFNFNWVDGNWNRVDHLDKASIEHLKGDTIIMTHAYKQSLRNSFVNLSHSDYDTRGIVIVFNGSTKETLKTFYLHSTDELYFTDIATNKIQMIYICGIFNDNILVNNDFLSSSYSVGFLAGININNSSTIMSKHGFSSVGHTFNIDYDPINNNIPIVGRLDNSSIFSNIVLESPLNTSDFGYGVFSMDNETITSSVTFSSDNVILYPNPTQGEIHLIEDSYYSIKNTFGLVIKTGYGKRIDLTGVKNGIYILELKDKRIRILKI